MRRAATLLLAALLAGCASPRHQDPPNVPTGDATSPAAMTLYLKENFTLSPEAPNSSAPAEVGANPVQNGFANEDLRVFGSYGRHPQWNVSEARLVVYYEARVPLVDPFVNQSDPNHARRFVFWLGSERIYPSSATITGPPVLAPGERMSAAIEFPLPVGGWIVPRDEPIRVFEASLVSNPDDDSVHFLVDAVPTPSRLELVVAPGSEALPRTLYESVRTYTLEGNSGLFTGATPSVVPSRLETTVDVPGTAHYAEFLVALRSNLAGKSDLDFEVRAPDGRLAGTSETPYQSETVRMFQPQLAAFGPGEYHLIVTAYSGVHTSFDLRTRLDVPR